MTVIALLDHVLFSNVHVQFFSFPFFLFYCIVHPLFCFLDSHFVKRLAYILKDAFFFLGVIILLLVGRQIFASWWCVLVYRSATPSEEDVMSPISASTEQPTRHICFLTFQGGELGIISFKFCSSLLFPVELRTKILIVNFFLYKHNSV